VIEETLIDDFILNPEARVKLEIPNIEKSKSENVNLPNLIEFHPK